MDRPQVALPQVHRFQCPAIQDEYSLASGAHENASAVRAPFEVLDGTPDSAPTYHKRCAAGGFPQCQSRAEYHPHGKRVCERDEKFVQISQEGFSSKGKLLPLLAIYRTYAKLFLKRGGSFSFHPLGAKIKIRSRLTPLLN